MVTLLKRWWQRIKDIPGGKWIFSRVAGLMIPYTGSVSPCIIEVNPGQAKVCIKDRRRVRNHLRSIHALALSNLGEFTTGLALHFALSDSQRAILAILSTEYLKKARGPITATAIIAQEQRGINGDTPVLATLCDDKGEIVARVTATWLVDEKKSSNPL